MHNNRSLIKQLKRHEGFRAKTYKCTAGALTIGYGHNLDANPINGLHAGSEISEERAEQILVEDIRAYCRDLDQKLPWWREHDEARTGVLANMCFNLGIGSLLKFKTTLSLIENKEYTSAAEQMLESKWARQVGGRAKELSRQMTDGVWV